MATPRSVRYVRSSTPLKLSLSVVAYLFCLLAGVWYASRHLQEVTDQLAMETVSLVGRELAAALADPIVGELASGSRVSQQQLLELARGVSDRSRLVASVAIVGLDGIILASSNERLMGDRDLTAAEAFADTLEAQVVRQLTRPGDPRRYLVRVPLFESGVQIAYLRASVASPQVFAAYKRARNTVALFALLGIAAIAGLVWMVRREGRRRDAFLAASLRRALEEDGNGAELPAELPGSYDQTFEAARLLGLELRQQRRRSSLERVRLTRIARVLDVGILLFNSDFELEFASSSALNLLGEALEGSDPPDGVMEQILRALSTDEGLLTSEVRTDLDLEIQGERIPLRLELFLLDENKDCGFLVLVRNREVILALETDLRLAAQLRGLSRLYLGVAHDLKAPLNAMGLNLALLRRSMETEGNGEETRERRRKWVAVVEEELKRLHRELERLLEQTAPAQDTAEDFDLRDLVESVRALLAPQARQQGVSVRTEVPPDPVVVHGRRDRIRQALINLAINALEVLPQGGRIELELQLPAEDGKPCTILVRDNGAGVAEEDRERIFEMHFSTKSGGTGIGLFVARSVVEAENGSLRLLESSASGTAFALSLPLKPIPAEPPAEDSAEKGSSPS